MRIQHNITAMNSYRNYTNNTGALAKNLEKLSSGYKINRAGDDAAGLAISEKMRAQISGLKQAQSNVKDGISLVKTAEGALQEVQDMMNRMVTLATQSANGTYDNKVDRANLQKEVEALKTEIDRIADSSNFNGTKLLDGSLAAGNVSASVPTLSGLDLTDVPAVKGQQTVTVTDAGASGTALSDGAVLKTTINYTDADGNSQSSTLKLTFDRTNKQLITEGGTKISLAAATHAAAAEVAKALAAAAAEDAGLSETFKIDGSAAAMKFDAKTAGANTKIESVVVDYKAAGASQTASIINPADGGNDAADAYQKIDMATAYTVGDVFSVGGEKFAFVNTQDDAVKMGEDGVNSIVLATANTVANGDVTKIADLIEQKTGYKPTVATTTLEFKAPADAKGKGGLQLQIGDTADSYNQLTVSVGNMHVKSLGLGSLDISTQEGAETAIEKIKNAINTVSSTRGDLGAIQNRLEHTTKNLQVMTENIQDAESTIRDVDIADEMTTYTKNNILLQSAQAMLAQANQMPQGVLQLLQ